ncbi:MAG TPA: glycogen debranching protein [Phycisphaerales bacterium]|nr:glycogen debranching protein [Phycisphaerales bacterium]
MTLHKTPPLGASAFIVERFDGHLRPSPDTEWLLSTGNGGFAMGTASPLNRRKYHALLVGSTNPPVERLSALAGVDVVVRVGEGAPTDLSTHRLADGSIAGAGVSRLVRFEKSPTRAKWLFLCDGVEITLELGVGWRQNSCALGVRVGPRGAPVALTLTPRVTLRDFHATLAQNHAGAYRVESSDQGVRVTRDARTLVMACTHGRFVPSPRVAPAVLLDFERERAQDDTECVFLPGSFDFSAPAGAGLFAPVLAAALEPARADPMLLERDERAAHLSRVRASFLRLHPGAGSLLPLVDAADDFLVDRTVDGRVLKTVIAGYPWFADWGRDTMISMVGLMIASGRFDDARGCLSAFARYVDGGMIPNHFDDYGGPPHYNTVDASLWFLHACAEYRRASADEPTFHDLLLPACLEIVERYRQGTRFGIRNDPADALIEAGDQTTQLTWMDAKRDGVVFTPRHGKAVEINALWHHGLRLVARAVSEKKPAWAAEFDALADRAGASFRALFVDERAGRLHDCLQRRATGGWAPVPGIRPNQVFAAALEYSPLSLAQRRMVVRDVERRFLTPFGLRTLDPADPAYQPRFEGDMMSRDRAYHNGTVWPWLLGPYCEAVLRAGQFSSDARAEVLRTLSPLLATLSTGCLGQIGEVYDAEPDQHGVRREQACVAQAWSVAEPLRVALMAMEG